MRTSLIGQAMPVLVPPAKEAILGRNCYLEAALFGARMRRAKPRNRLELEPGASSLSTYSCK